MTDMNPNTTVITLIVNRLHIPIRRQRLPDFFKKYIYIYTARDKT